MLTGGCLCGAVRYRIGSELRSRVFCHCESCRRSTGAPYVAWATVDVEGFQLIEDGLEAFRSSVGVERRRCRTCGCAITYQHDQRPGELDVATATLDDPMAVRPEFHIWVSEKLPWVELGDGLPQYPGWRSDPAD